MATTAIKVTPLLLGSVLAIAGCVAAPPLVLPPKKVAVVPDFALSQIPEVPLSQVEQGHEYRLPELID